jgi:hypothetical protein
MIGGVMETITKKYNFKEINYNADTGEFKAIFSTLNAKDKDGDITLPGAFGEQNVIIAAYNHGSWNSGMQALPVGKGKIYEQGSYGIVEGKFFLDTNAGIETYKTIKNIGEMQEWSYSLPEIDYEIRMEDGERIRVLKKIRVNEVSPVLMGAGNGTRLLDIKNDKGAVPVAVQFEAVLKAVEDFGGRIKALGELRAKDDRRLSDEKLNNLKQIKTLCLGLIGGLDEIIDSDFKDDRRAKLNG